MKSAWTRLLPASVRARIEGRHYLQNVISNTGWQFADNILRMGVGLLVGIWVARYLGPEKYGMLSYALALVSIFSPLATLGLEDIVVRDIVRQPDCKEETLGTAFVLKLMGSFVSFMAVVVTIFFLRPTDKLSHWLVGIIAGGSIIQAFNITECWFNSQIQAKYIVFARNSAFIICSVIKIALIMNGASVVAFAVVFTIEVGIGSLGLLVAYKAKGGSFKKWQVTRERAGLLLRDSWPLFFSIISIVIYQRIDQVMLQQMVGSKEVGIYSVAVALVGAWAFIPSAIYWSFFPGILYAKQVSEEHFYDQLQKFYNLMALLSYVIAFATTLLAPWLIPALYGEAYSRASLMLIVLVWANIFTSLEIARTAFMNAMNLNRLYFVMITAGGVINVILNIFLIPRFGGVGAAIASLVAYWFAAHGSCIFFRSMHKTGFMLSKAIVYPKIW
jgi:O-antigen/teichoic acid export membrane protein